MKYDALLVVDVQTALINGHPYNETHFLENIQKLLLHFREHKVPVIFVRHDGGKGDELEYGSEGWEICKAVAPLDEETIIDKQFNSCFRKTGLQQELLKLDAHNLVLCGMQTEHCIDATCKVAFEYGYQITIFKDTTTTYDNTFLSGQRLTEYYEEKIWNNRYASLVPLSRLTEFLPL